MRIKAAIVIVAVVGLVLAANLLIDNRTMSPLRFAETTKVCAQCHGIVPEYDTVLVLHDKMAAFDCSFCHSDRHALKTTDKVHGGLQWLGSGMVLVALTGITTSLVIINRRDKAN